jgi:carboxyl-terminal processing protease
MLENKNYYPFYIALIFLGGLLIGENFSTPKSTSNTENNKILNILNYIKTDYVDSISDREMDKSLIQAMLDKLDPHSVYITKEEFNAANDPLLGKFDGIGVQFRMVNDTVVVILALENGPSKKAGIIAGDRILIANADTLAGKKYSSLDIQSHLKGKSGTPVSLVIKRPNQEKLLHINLKRAPIPTHSIDAEFMLNDSTAYIKLSRFSATTIEEFSDAMSSLNNQGMKKLILDLRGNGGGYLGAAIYIADQFLEKGRLIVYTQGRNRPKKIYKASSDTGFPDGEVVILIDGNTASASEIVSGALQDNDRAVIIGRRSFGKGLVQEQMNYRDGSALRLTVARYYTPSGRSIQRPYTKGKEDYYQHYYKRLYEESLVIPDSTSINDSLKYKTLKGRTVYGGGGIWPDHFILADTNINFTFYNRLLNQSLIYQYAFNYVDKHRKQLSKYANVNSFKDNFQLSDAFYRDFLLSKNIQKLKPTKKAIQKSKPYILNLLKAEIARNLFEDGFYPVYIENDRFVKAALSE